MSFSSPTIEKEFYRRRISAHKWLLVTCFGYLGYKNARFGRIEAHEAVTAYGREMLLRAKEIAEDHGFRVLHMLTDSLWVQKRGTTEAEYEDVTREIERATNLPIELDSLYKWVAFLPSRVNPYAAVPNRYFGVRHDGEIKVRGIEMRRGDTPKFIKDLQADLLAEMAKAPSRRELAARVPRLLEIVAARLDALRAGQVPLQDLMLTYCLSRNPQEYTTNTLNAIVARELAGRGVTLAPGESVCYVITDYRAAVPSDRARSSEFVDGSWGCDVERYAELSLRAVETVLTPLGINGKMLQDWVKKELPANHVRARLEAKRSREYLGPLFAPLESIAV